MKLYRTRGNIGDKKYDAAKKMFQDAEDNKLTGNNTNPSTDQINTAFDQGRTGKAASKLSYSQMVKSRAGLRGDLKKGVELEPHFTLDKGAHSDLYLRRRKNKKTNAGETLARPM